MHDSVSLPQAVVISKWTLLLKKTTYINYQHLQFIIVRVHLLSLDYQIF